MSKETEYLTAEITHNHHHHITEDSTLKEIVQSDLSVANAVLDSLFVAWNSVKTISSVCNLATTTMKVLEQRRSLALKPNSYTDIINQQKTKALLNQNSISIPYEPLE